MFGATELALKMSQACPGTAPHASLSSCAARESVTECKQHMTTACRTPCCVRTAHGQSLADVNRRAIA